jgi:osmotically-inducible protein OsmY
MDLNPLKRIPPGLIAAVLLAVAGCATERQGVGSYFDDASITARVKSAIYNEPSLKVTDISVKTEDKVVVLSGSVKSRAEAARAVQVARKVEGVKTVKNGLEVKP